MAVRTLFCGGGSSISRGFYYDGKPKLVENLEAQLERERLLVRQLLLSLKPP